MIGQMTANLPYGNVPQPSTIEDLSRCLRTTQTRLYPDIHILVIRSREPNLGVNAQEQPRKREENEKRVEKHSYLLPGVAVRKRVLSYPTHNLSFDIETAIVIIVFNSATYVPSHSLPVPQDVMRKDPGTARMFATESHSLATIERCVMAQQRERSKNQDPRTRETPNKLQIPNLKFQKQSDGQLFGLVLGVCLGFAAPQISRTFSNLVKFRGAFSVTTATSSNRTPPSPG